MSGTAEEAPAFRPGRWKQEIEGLLGPAMSRRSMMGETNHSAIIGTSRVSKPASNASTARPVSITSS